MIATLVDLSTRAIAAARAGRATDALVACDQALVLDPRCEDAAAWRAVALAMLGRAKEARAAARACLRAHPGNDVVLDLLARIGDDEPVRSRSVADTWETGGVIRERWEIFGSAGGAMGRVYFVRDREWGGMELAIKSLAPSAVDNEMARRLFRRETQVWLDLGGHPHIVSGFYTIELERQLRFFMEYVEGTSMDDVLVRAGGALPLPRALDLAIQLAAGMAYAHAKGVVHRDLKPANVMVTSDDVVKVTDFGLGRSLARFDAQASASAASAMSMSMAGDSMLDQAPGGTPLYMAPEQWRALSEATTAADVYAFGALLYEILVGERPFEAEPSWLHRFTPRLPREVRELQHRGPIDPLGLLRHLHQNMVPVPLRERGVAIPGALDSLIQRCLLKNADARPSFTRLRRDLVDLYELATGTQYSRELGTAIEPTEAGENNRAVSYFIMGKAGRARQILAGWLHNHPTALYTWMNHATMGIRSGEVDPTRVAADFFDSVAGAHRDALEREPAVVEFVKRLAPYLVRTGAPVTALAQSTGRLAVGHADGRITVWRTDTGVKECTYDGHEQRVSALAFDESDGLVSASFDRTVRRWDSTRGTSVVLRGSSNWSTAVVALGDHVIGGSNDGFLRVWDRSRGALVQTIPAHREWIEDLVRLEPSRGEVRFASASRDGTVKVWRVDGKGTISIIHTIEVGGNVVAIGELGGDIVIAGRTGSIGGWRNGWQWRVETEGNPVGLVVDAKRQVVLVATSEGTVHVIDARSGTLVRSSDGGAVSGEQIAAAGSDADTIWVGGENGVVTPIRLAPANTNVGGWPLITRRPKSAGVQAKLERERDRLTALVESGNAAAHDELDKFRLANDELTRSPAIQRALHRSGLRSGILRGLRDVWTTWHLELEETVTAIGVDATGSRAWVGLRSGVVASVEMATGQVSTQVAEVGSSRASVPLAISCLAAGGALIAYSDGSLARVASDGSTLLWKQPGHARAPVGVSRLRGDSRAVTAGTDGVLVWNVDDGAVLNRVTSVAASALATDGDDAVVIASATRLGLYKLVGDNVERDRHIELGNQRALVVAASPMGFVVRTPSTTARVISRRGGRAIQTMEGATFALNALALDPSARLTATASRDYNDTCCHVWSTAGGTVVRSLEHGTPVHALAFLPDGSGILTGDQRGGLRLWTLDIDWCRGNSLAIEAETLAAGGSSSLWPFTDASTAAELQTYVIDELERASASCDAISRERVIAAVVKLREQIAVGSPRSMGS